MKVFADIYIPYRDSWITSVISVVLELTFRKLLFMCNFVCIILLLSSSWTLGEKKNIGMKHGFPFINIRKVPREGLKTEGETRGFQHLPRDLSNVNEWQNHVWSLLLHTSNENSENGENNRTLYSSAVPLALFTYAHVLL